MLYLLDTCILSYLEDPQSPFHKAVLAALATLAPEDDLCLSILSVYELEYGLKRAGKNLAREIEEAKRRALDFHRILPLTRQGAVIFADLKVRYREVQKKRMAGKELSKHLSRHTVDFVIASSAVEHRATVVSNDQIFSSLRQILPDLLISDWTTPDSYVQKRP